jgi:protein-S-isoprenylcysteine O-methyltransferase Ste14
MGVLRWLGIAPLLAGSWVVLRCLFAFSWKGRGTPAPFDPPRALVVVGPYRYVRNPMYFGAALVILGGTVLWGSIVNGLVYVAVFLGGLIVFVIVYEEPTLRGKFGANYEEYCRHVPRLIPRMRPWDGAGGSPRAGNGA